MTLNKFLDPKNDFAFKKIFGNEKNKNILISFLNDLFDGRKGEKLKIQDVSFLNNSTLDPDTQAKKQSIVDVLCVDEAGIQYIVEMQVARSKGFEKRAQYYAAKAYVNQMKAGDAYHDLKEIIFLAITDFTMFPDKASYRSDHVTLDQDSFHHNLKDFSFCFLELPKFTKTIDELKSSIDKWMYFFKHAPETTDLEMGKAIGENEAIRDAYKVVDRYFWTEKEINTYEHEKKTDLDNKAVWEAALDQKLDEGIVIGIEKGKIEMARNMLAYGMKIEDVMRVTGLSIEQLRNL
jgi:predicted transposase/invertase (TIGR01784 family)